MLHDCLRLALVLEALCSGGLNAPAAEQRLQASEPHHVFDPDGLLGLDPLAQVPVRQALARLEHGLPHASTTPVWALLLPRPGRMAGLRGPVEVNRAAVEAGAVVMTHDGSLCWLGSRVGAGVQWRLARAERPLPPLDPREAARQLASAVAEASSGLAGLDLAAGQRPGRVHAPVLGRGFPARSQDLVDRAWLVLAAADAALAAQTDVLHSHAVLAREQHLHRLAAAALDALSAAVSWPSRAIG